MANNEEKDTKQGKQRTRDKVIAVLILAGVIALMLVLIWQLFGQTFIDIIRLMKRGDEEEIGAYLNAQGQWKGMFSVFLMSVLQVVSIFIPGLAVQVAAGVIYGWWKSFLLTYTGFVAGNVLVFCVARKLGNRVSDILELGKKNNKLESMVNDYSPVFVLSLAYLIPGIPNGFIPYFASRLDIRWKSFAKSVAASSWIQILCNCIAGHFLIRGQYLFMIISFAVQIVLIIVIAYNRNWFLSLGNKKSKK